MVSDFQIHICEHNLFINNNFICVIIPYYRYYCVLVIGIRNVPNWLAAVAVGGIAHFHFMYVFRELVLPLLLPQVDVLLVPFFLARCVGWYLSAQQQHSGVLVSPTTIYTTSAQLVRNCHHIYLLVRLALWVVRSVLAYLRALFVEAKTAMELTDAQLVNRNS